MYGTNGYGAGFGLSFALMFGLSGVAGALAFALVGWYIEAAIWFAVFTAATIPFAGLARQELKESKKH